MFTKAKETLLPFLNRPKASLISAFWCSKNKIREIGVGADGAFKAEQIRKSFLIRDFSVSSDCFVCEEVVSQGPIIRSRGFSYRCYADDTWLYLLSPPGEPSVSDKLSNYFSANQSLHHNTDTLSLAPTTAVPNRGVMIDAQLTASDLRKSGCS